MGGDGDESSGDQGYDSGGSSGEDTGGYGDAGGYQDSGYGYGDSGTGEGSGGGDAGSCLIVFGDMALAGYGGIGAAPLVQIDPDDNPDNHVVLHIGAGCQAVWLDVNAGTAACDYSDTTDVDGTAQPSVDNLSLGPQQSDWRTVKLGRVSAGRHTFTATLNGGTQGTHDFDVSDT